MHWRHTGALHHQPQWPTIGRASSCTICSNLQGLTSVTRDYRCRVVFAIRFLEYGYNIYQPQLACLDYVSQLRHPQRAELPCSTPLPGIRVFYPGQARGARVTVIQALSDNCSYRPRAEDFFSSQVAQFIGNNLDEALVATLTVLPARRVDAA